MFKCIDKKRQQEIIILDYESDDSGLPDRKGTDTLRFFFWLALSQDAMLLPQSLADGLHRGTGQKQRIMSLGFRGCFV